MKDNPTVCGINIFPIKALDGIALQTVMITTGGCLLHDREYAIADVNGNFIIGKTNDKVHSLRSAFDFENGVVSFRHRQQTTWDYFDLENEKPAIETYLSAFFGIPCTLLQNKTGRFLDIPDTSGITIVSTATLHYVSGWFNLDLEETRKRFRATIEIENVPAFWEDHLFLKEGTAIEFKLGDVTLSGISPRARCVVPTRNPESGEVTHAFPKIFAKQRAASLPQWSNLKDYGHYYYLTVDCHIPSAEIGKWISIGDEVRIIGERRFY